MYCQACGAEVQEGLRYCNRCGANLIAESSAAPPRLFAIILTLAIAALLVGVIGLAALFFFAIEFMGRGNVPAEVVLFLIVFALVFFGIEALIIRQLSRLIGIYLQTGGEAPKEKRSINKSQTPSQLSEARQNFAPAASQSPHTTASDEVEATTRILSEQTATTRKLENDK